MKHNRKICYLEIDQKKLYRIKPERNDENIDQEVTNTF